MVNRAGENGVDNGTRPSDDELREILHEFARKRWPTERRLRVLRDEHNYSIKKTKLNDLNNIFGVPSARKPIPKPLATALVAEHVEHDTSRRHGPTRVQRKIIQKHNVHIPRDEVRKIQKRIDPEGAQARFPQRGRHQKVRGQLTAVGIMQEVHCDGHEKLGGIALRLGGVGFGIYAFRDHTGRILHADVVPNDRDQITVCHCYLDFVDVMGEIPIQLTFDGGTETAYMAAAQTEFRRMFLGEDNISELDKPSTRALKSTDNIPVESCWSYWIADEGENIKCALLEAHRNGLFAPGNPLHVHLFQWLWSRIIRNHLRQFQEYFNSNPRRSQKEKLLPTAAPDDVFDNPESFGLERCGTSIPKEAIQQFRDRLPLTREHVMRWVLDEFDKVAHELYEQIGSPTLEHPYIRLGDLS